jgi:hypothetical protein
VSLFKNDRNMEQMLSPITVIRGGTSRGFYFEQRNVAPQGKGLEEFLLSVRGSPDPMAMDGLGGESILQSKVAIVSPSERRRPIWITRSCRSTRRSPRPSCST